MAQRRRHLRKATSASARGCSFRWMSSFSAAARSEASLLRRVNSLSRISDLRPALPCVPSNLPRERQQTVSSRVLQKGTFGAPAENSPPQRPNGASLVVPRRLPLFGRFRLRERRRRRGLAGGRFRRGFDRRGAAQHVGGGGREVLRRFGGRRRGRGRGGFWSFRRGFRLGRLTGRRFRRRFPVGGLGRGSFRCRGRRGRGGWFRRSGRSSRWFGRLLRRFRSGWRFRFGRFRRFGFGFCFGLCFGRRRLG